VAANTLAGRQFDVCVLGAGPAGLAAASRLVDHGREVLILDRATARSRWGGETFTGAIRGPLSELGCWEAFERAGHVAGYELQCAWGGEPRAENALFQPEGPRWHVDRDRFDADLRCAVHQRGAVFDRYRKLESVRSENGCWSVALGRGRVVGARYLVDATGRQRTLSRRLGARIESHDRLVGLTARVARHQATAELRSMLLQATPFGWWYAAPIPDGHVLVLFTDTDLAPLGLRRRLRPTAANSAFTDTGGAQGWLAVGDACASHDPLCGWGVHRALSNGLLAGDAIASLLATGNSGPIVTYRRHCREQYDRYLRGLTHRYSLERRWPTAPFWARRHRPM
jgi:flavin-dependent dehydrogenase